MRPTSHGRATSCARGTGPSARIRPPVVTSLISDAICSGLGIAVGVDDDACPHVHVRNGPSRERRRRHCRGRRDRRSERCSAFPPGLRRHRSGVPRGTTPPGSSRSRDPDCAELAAPRRRPLQIRAVSSTPFESSRSLRLVLDGRSARDVYRGDGPFSVGRDGSADHSDQEPG